MPISCHCWNDNSWMHLAANSGPNFVRQHLFSAQQRANAVPNSGFLTSRMVCRSKSDTSHRNLPSMGRTPALLMSKLAWYRADTGPSFGWRSVNLKSRQRPLFSAQNLTDANSGTGPITIPDCWTIDWNWYISRNKNRIRQIADGFWRGRVVLNKSVDRNEQKNTLFLSHNLKYHRKPSFLHFEVRISQNPDVLEQFCGRI